MNLYFPDKMLYRPYKVISSERSMTQRSAPLPLALMSSPVVGSVTKVRSALGVASKNRLTVKLLGVLITGAVSLFFLNSASSS